MTTFEIESVEPMSDRAHPRQLAREAISNRGQETLEQKFVEAQKAVVAGPLANQHQQFVRPRLNVDEILNRSFKNLGK
jgi:hypothetical protein